MNLFRRNIGNYPEDEKNQNEYENFEINTDWENSYKKNNDKDIPDKEVYYPNALLFRSLLEGTSFDRRISEKKIAAVKPIQAKPEDVLDISLQQKIPAIETYPVKRPAKSSNYYKPLKKRKFITEKEQKRLGHIVKKVLGPTKD